MLGGGACGSLASLLALVLRVRLVFAFGKNVNSKLKLPVIGVAFYPFFLFQVDNVDLDDAIGSPHMHTHKNTMHAHAHTEHRHLTRSVCVFCACVTGLLLSRRLLSVYLCPFWAIFVLNAQFGFLL